MTFKIIGKKDAQKGFSLNSLIEIANGVRVKIADLIALKNGTLTPETHEISDETMVDLGNGVTMKIGDLVNQEIDLGNGEKGKLLDLVKSGRVKIGNEKTDKEETADEKAAREKEEGKKAEDLKNESIKNCGCANKEDGEHKEGCALYNSKGAIAFRNSKKDEATLKNEKILALENEIKALKEGVIHADTFIRVTNAKKTGETEQELLLQNATLDSGSMEAGLTRARDYFGTVNKN